MPSNEVLASAAFFIASVLAALWSYLRKPPPAPSTSTAVLAGIAGELGNRPQMDELIGEVKRIADAIEAKKQAGMDGKLTEILERMDEAEERQQRSKR